MSLPQTSSAPAASNVPPARSRGAQKHNTNAFRHGDYSKLNPSRLAQLAGLLQIYSSSALPAPAPIPSPADPVPSSSDPTLLSLRSLNLEILSILDVAYAEHDSRLIISGLKHLVRTTLKINRHILGTGAEYFELRRIALYACVLPIWQFKYYYGVTRDVWQDPPFTAPADSFGLKLKKNGQKSSPYVSISPASNPDSATAAGLLTFAQVQRIAHLLPAAPIKGRRGRPSASALDVLNAIFWKVSHGLPWHALPDGFPPARTCRRYYERWLHSGRLLTIYKNLLKDLLLRGRVDPLDFVEDGCFCLTSDYRVCFTPACPDTWQAHTALFFFQQSYALIRRVRREEKDPYFP